MPDARRVRRSARVTASARRRVVLDQLEPSVAVWDPHHGDVRPDSLERNDAIHRAALDRRLALQLESELNEERHRVGEVVDDNAHVVHPLDCHVLDGRHATEPVGELSRGIPGDGPGGSSATSSLPAPASAPRRASPRRMTSTMSLRGTRVPLMTRLPQRLATHLPVAKRECARGVDTTSMRPARSTCRRSVIDRCYCTYDVTYVIGWA